MARRQGWMYDHHYALNQGPGRPTDDQEHGRATLPAPSPVNVTININLGDLIDKLVSRKVTTKEAMVEAVEISRRRRIVEDV